MDRVMHCILTAACTGAKGKGMIGLRFTCGRIAPSSPPRALGNRGMPGAPFVLFSSMWNLGGARGRVVAPGVILELQIWPKHDLGFHVSSRLWTK